MRFSCDRDSLAREIGNAQDVIASRNVLSILSNVYLSARDDKLLIKATDLKVSFETTLAVSVATPGVTTVFCDKLLGVLRSLPPGEVELLLDAEQMLLEIRPTHHRIDFALRSISPEKYPEQQEVPDELYFSFPQKDLLDMVAKTIFAVSDDETRYFLNGVYVEKVDDGLRMVATDGKRLSLVTKVTPVSAANLKGVIVPPKIFHLARKLATGEGELGMALTDKNLFLRFGAYHVASNLIDAQFPQYDRVIPRRQESRLLVKTAALVDALKRVSLLVEQKSRKILVTVREGLLTIHTAEGEIGKASEEIPCEYQGDEVTFAANYLYLLDPLKEMTEETCAIEFTESDKALTLRSEPASDYFHVVMPMQQA